MGNYAAFQPCQNTSPCMAQIKPGDMPAHLAWHATLNNNNALIKVILPGLNVSAV